MHCRVSFVVLKVDDVVEVELDVAERRNELHLPHDGGRMEQRRAPRTELRVRIETNPDKHLEKSIPVYNINLYEYKKYGFVSHLPDKATD